MNEYPIKSIMSTKVLSVSPGTTVVEVATLMSKQKYSCLPVVDAGKPVGIITERDIVRYFAKFMVEDGSQQPAVAADIMSKSLIVMHQDQSLLDALVVSQTNKVRHLPVVDDEELLKGIVTYTDIINVQRSILESQTAIIERSIEHRTAELVEANRLLQEMSLVDPLLSIGNRRAMKVDIETTHNLSSRYKDNYSIAMIDVDNFKLYNDHYGHQAGDETLQAIATLIKESIRATDRVYRYGGEEILILLPKTNIDGANILATRILNDIALQKIPHEKSLNGVVTVSCGLAVYDSESVQAKSLWTDVVKSADTALYEAKSAGRNRVVNQSFCA